jgi:hypothetical protein
VAVCPVTIGANFLLAHKLNLKESPPFDSVALALSNWIPSVAKTLDSDTVFILLNDGARRLKKLNRRQ